MSVLADLWTRLRGDETLLDQVVLTGPERVLPSIFDVTAFAAATNGVAALAAAELLAARTGTPVRSVVVDRRRASAAYLSERLFAPIGWHRPAVWDPIAGDYATKDGWIRLHTNYRNHRDAVLRALGLPADGSTTRESVAAAVAGWEAVALETSVVELGGAAAAMRDRMAWLRSDAGQAALMEPLIRAAHSPASGALRFPVGEVVTRPLQGVRVLDLTRVIAGPGCTRFLAAHGADVLRIDPPGFDEVAAIVPDTSVGKRRTRIDLRTDEGRAIFDTLVASADVVVSGYRNGALESLGVGTDRLRALNPDLVVASLNAYGWTGPWSTRRGFDSLVQMSTGIAHAAAAAAGLDEPVSLPAQALDHGTGDLLAASVCRSLTDIVRAGRTATIRCSLVATANLLANQLDPEGPTTPAPIWTDDDTVEVATAWGPARRTPIAGSIDGIEASWAIDAGPLGTDPATFAPRAG